MHYSNTPSLQSLIRRKEAIERNEAGEFFFSRPALKYTRVEQCECYLFQGGVDSIESGDGRSSR
jgi:hypothetical protein